VHPFNIWNKNHLMSLFQFYLYIAGCLHVSGPQAHPQESSRSCSHNHWFSVCTALAVCCVCCHIQSTRPEQYRHWTNGCVNSCVNSPEDGPMGPKHVEIRQYINKIEKVTSVLFHTFLKFLSRNCWYCVESVTQAVWPPRRQCYRRAYGALRHISHSPFDLLCVIRMKYSVDVNFFCSYVIQIVQRILTVETSVRKKSHERCRTVLRIQVPCG